MKKLKSLVVILVILILFSGLLSAGDFKRWPESVQKIVEEEMVVIYIDISSDEKTLTLIRNYGSEIYTWPCSPGKKSFSTPRGRFQIYQKYKNAFSKKYGVGMLYWLGFTSNNLYGIHALYGKEYLKFLGQPASHGCVRLSPEAAKFLFENVPVGTTVIIS